MSEYGLKTKHIFFLSLALFILLVFVLPTNLLAYDFSNTILTVVTFLFGILAGFYIVVTHADYVEFKNQIATEIGAWHALYHSVGSYDKSTQAVFSESLDQYIIRSFDHEIIDYAKITEKEFEAIEKIINDLPRKSELSSIYEVGILNNLNLVRETRHKLFTLGTKTLSFFQWLILFILAGILIFTLMGLRTGGLFFNIITASISSGVVLILLLIRELDLYIWNEKTFGYEAFESLFKTIGKLPYYPDLSIKAGRYNPPESKYRIGILTKQPDGSFRRNKIEIVDNK